MNAFDYVIGYDSVKSRLMDICRMFSDPKPFLKLGAKLPSGILLEGEPGLGKTLMAKCFLAECGAPSFILRRDCGGALFVDHILEVFHAAKETAPAVILLDDMDKFSETDRSDADAEEFVAVQTGMDEVRSSGVLVVATVNNSRKLPNSLKRPGRFDCVFSLSAPGQADAEAIVRHYLEGKPLGADVDPDDVAKMVTYRSCAALESTLNRAAMKAGAAGRRAISREDFISVVLEDEFSSDDPFGYRATDADADLLARAALHEAGHLVVSEALDPGCAGLSAIRVSGRDTEGFVRRTRRAKSVRDDILISLAGKAAVELYYAPGAAVGCASDLGRAKNLICTGMSTCATHGIGLLEMADETDWPSDDQRTALEAASRAELERCLQETRAILMKNRAFLERAARALCEKRALTASEIRALREEAAEVKGTPAFLCPSAA